MGACRGHCRDPPHYPDRRAGLALPSALGPGCMGRGRARRQQRPPDPGRRGAGDRVASVHSLRDRGYRRSCLDRLAAMEDRRAGVAGADGHARGREATQAVGGPPSAGLYDLPLPFGPCGSGDRGGPQPSADRALVPGAIGDQDGRGRRHGPVRALNGLDAAGRDSAPVLRRRRGGGDGGGGDPGRRPVAGRLSPGPTPRVPSPASREVGRTADRPRARAARPWRRRPGSCSAP